MEKWRLLLPCPIQHEGYDEEKQSLKQTVSQGERKCYSVATIMRIKAIKLKQREGVLGSHVPKTQQNVSNSRKLHPISNNE